MRITFFSFAAFSLSILSSRCVSVNGPFFTERPIYCLPSAVVDDEFVRALVVACLEAARRLAPRGYRMASARCLAFAAAVRVIDRIHRNAAVVRALAHPALASRFAERNVFVIAVADRRRWSPCSRSKRAGLRPKAVSAAPRRLRAKPAAPACRPNAPSARPCRAAVQCCGRSVPAGIFLRGRALPTRMSASGPEETVAPTARPSGAMM